MGFQAPLEVQQELKDWGKPKGEALSVEDALVFGPVLRRLLEEKGIPTDRGCCIQQITIDDDELGPAGEKDTESDGAERESLGVKVVGGRRYESHGGERESLGVKVVGNRRYRSYD